MKIIIFPLIISIYLCNPSVSLAQSDSYDLLRHLESGARFFDQGERDKAKSHFIEALLIDHPNPEAKKYLRKITEKQSIAESAKLLRFLDLIDYCEFLHNRVSSIKKESNAHLDFIHKYGKTQKQVIEKSHLIKDEMERIAASLKQNKIHYRRIDEINEAILREKNQTYEKLAYLQKLNSQLRNLKLIVTKNLSLKETPLASSNLVDEIKKLKLYLAQKELALADQESNMEHLENEIVNFRVESQQIRTELKKTDRKVVDLTKKLAGMSLEVYEKDSLLGSKEHRLSILEDELKDTQERLNLVQHIIKKKDEHIQKLEEELRLLQRQSKDGLAEKKRMEDLSSGLSDLNTKMREQSKYSIEQIQALEEQVRTINEKYLVMEAKILKRDIQIAQMSQQIIQKEDKLKKYKKIFLSKDQKLVEYAGILQIYKEKLSDTFADLKEKERQINLLKKKLKAFPQKIDQISLEDVTEPSELSNQEINISDIHSLSQNKILLNTFVELNSLQKNIQE